VLNSLKEIHQSPSPETEAQGAASPREVSCLAKPSLHRQRAGVKAPVTPRVSESGGHGTHLGGVCVFVCVCVCVCACVCVCVRACVRVRGGVGEEKARARTEGEMKTGISEASKRVSIFSFATQGGKQVSFRVYFRQGNWVQAREAQIRFPAG